MKGRRTIQIFLLVFVVYAVYTGHKKFFNALPSKVSKSLAPDQQLQPADNTESNVQATQPTESSADDKIVDIKFASKDEDSAMQQWFTYALNKILDNQQGRSVFKEVVQKMLMQQGNMLGYDLFTSRYMTYDHVVGTGKEAACSDTVEITYTIKAGEADQKQPSELSKSTFVIGSGTLADGLENGIIGMREGGRRMIVYPGTKFAAQAAIASSPQAMASRDSGAATQLNKQPGVATQITKPESGKPNNLTAEVTLQTVQKPVYKNVFGAPLLHKPAAGSAKVAMMCGDTVSGSYSVTRLDIGGSKEDSHDVAFKVGSMQYPQELSEAIIGLPTSGAEVFFITTSDKVNAVFSKNASPASAAYPVLLKFSLQGDKTTAALPPQASAK